MNSQGLFKRITITLRKQPLKVFTYAFVVYATIWTILEPLIGIVPNASRYFSGEIKFISLILISVLIGAYRSAIPQEANLKYGNSNIKIVFGDLFSFDGIKVIPVSRFFHETQVIPASLQGKLIQKFAQSGEGSKGFETYEKIIADSLHTESFQEVFRDETQQNERFYPLGTTVLLSLDGQPYILFSLTETELKGYIPGDNCNALKMWIALEAFWKKARIYARGNPINIPLIGSGVTGIRLDSIHLLELNLLAIANSLEEGGKITTEEIRIILHSKYLEDIDLSKFQDIWG
ncbi:macro domain-containing protein [Stenomitos frigidus]|uniref:Thoeris protein ThsA Macro domain-containing protein n=1 Tax=Stenomitos frigidus ULC18 TaxID=2107698 RepID=A0A2T1DZ84_9CYAN|nr:macro domain-containing protein [Stenomitos frigidus]PSB25817.1 hypothetical protein C7B82_21735 [Stenomitos frigidus ULC18]